MKSYVAITGLVFLAILVAHCLRLRAEGRWLLHEPTFLLTSLLSAAIALWAATLLARRKP